MKTTELIPSLLAEPGAETPRATSPEAAREFDALLTEAVDHEASKGANTDGLVAPEITGEAAPAAAVVRRGARTFAQAIVVPVAPRSIHETVTRALRAGSQAELAPRALSAPLSAETLAEDYVGNALVDEAVDAPDFAPASDEREPGVDVALESVLGHVAAAIACIVAPASDAPGEQGLATEPASVEIRAATSSPIAALAREDAGARRGERPAEVSRAPARVGEDQLARAPQAESSAVARSSQAEPSQAEPSQAVSSLRAASREPEPAHDAAPAREPSVPLTQERAGHASEDAARGLVHPARPQRAHAPAANTDMASEQQVVRDASVPRSDARRSASTAESSARAEQTVVADASAGAMISASESSGAAVVRDAEPASAPVQRERADGSQPQALGARVTVTREATTSEGRTAPSAASSNAASAPVANQASSRDVPGTRALAATRAPMTQDVSSAPRAQGTASVARPQPSTPVLAPAASKVRVELHAPSAAAEADPKTTAANAPAPRAEAVRSSSVDAVVAAAAQSKVQTTVAEQGMDRAPGAAQASAPVVVSEALAPSTRVPVLVTQLSPSEPAPSTTPAELAPSSRASVAEEAPAKTKSGADPLSRVEGFSREARYGMARSAYAGRGHDGAEHDARGRRGEEREHELTREAAGSSERSWAPAPELSLPLQVQPSPVREAPPPDLAPARAPLPVAPPPVDPELEFARLPEAAPQSASISLHHPDLGPIQIQVQRAHDRVEVSAVIESTHAEAVLRANESGIRQGVQQSGMTFGALRVRVRSDERERDKEPTRPAQVRRRRVERGI